MLSASPRGKTSKLFQSLARSDRSPSESFCCLISNFSPPTDLNLFYRHSQFLQRLMKFFRGQITEFLLPRRLVLSCILHLLLRRRMKLVRLIRVPLVAQIRSSNLCPPTLPSKPSRLSPRCLLAALALMHSRDRPAQTTWKLV
jgi:hypothetical protein